MKILSVESGPVATIGYLIYDDATLDSVIIDVPFDSAGYFIDKLSELKLHLNAILLTHSHWDHTADCPRLKKATNAPVYIFHEDEYRITAPLSHTIWPLPFNLEPMKADKYLKDNEMLIFGSLQIEVRFTPGHTEGGACFIFQNEKTVFTGDTLFNMSIGRVDLPGGNYEQLMKSVKDKLMSLDDDFKVYSGHGDMTNIGFERRNNQFLNNDLIINL